MNDRVQALALVAEEYAYTKPNEFFTTYTDRFAELIVRECCQKLENDGMVEVAMEIKEYFGVR